MNNTKLKYVGKNQFFLYKSGSDTSLNKKSEYKNRIIPKEFVYPHSVISFSDAS